MPDLLDRIADKFTVGDDCWEWTAGRNVAGYGKVWLDGQTLYAHRLFYEMFVGPIPDGMQLDHLCRNRSCVRPAHLEPVTLIENWERGETPSRLKALQTHCDYGHAFDDENTYVTPDGRRQCRACRRRRGG